MFYIWLITIIIIKFCKKTIKKYLFYSKAGLKPKRLWSHFNYSMTLGFSHLFNHLMIQVTHIKLKEWKESCREMGGVFLYKKDENDHFYSTNVLLWTPTYGCARAGRPARTYIQQLCEDTGCNPEDLPEAMNDREKWRERVKDIRAGGATWWWWWYY